MIRTLKGIMPWPIALFSFYYAQDFIISHNLGSGVVLTAGTCVPISR